MNGWLRTMNSAESDVCYFEVDAVFNWEPVGCWRRVCGLQDVTKDDGLFKCLHKQEIV